MGLLRLALGVGVSIAVVACAGGAPAPAVGEAFARDAEAVCAEALESKGAWAPFPVSDFDPMDPDPSAFPVVAAWLAEEVSPTFEGWRDGLTALGSPPTGSDAWAAVLERVGSIADLNAAQVAAAQAGDPTAFAAATSALAAAQPALLSAAGAAGVPGCAEVHAS